MRMCLSELEMARDAKEIHISGPCATALSSVSSVFLAGAHTGIWYMQKVRAAETWFLGMWAADPQATHDWSPRRVFRRSLFFHVHHWSEWPEENTTYDTFSFNRKSSGI